MYLYITRLSKQPYLFNRGNFKLNTFMTADGGQCSMHEARFQKLSNAIVCTLGLESPLEQNPPTPQLAPPRKRSSPNQDEDSGDRAILFFAQVIKNI